MLAPALNQSGASLLVLPASHARSGERIFAQTSQSTAWRCPDAAVSSLDIQAEQPSPRRRLRRYEGVSTHERLDERSDIQVLQFDQHLSTFIQEANVELPDAGVILSARVCKFRVRITHLRHGADDIDLVQRKRQLRRRRFQTSRPHPRTGKFDPFPDIQPSQDKELCGVQRFYDALAGHGM